MSAYRGVRIVDFTQGVAGPMAAMLLGDLEAEIVKVEPPGGDRAQRTAGYQTWNRNKQVLTLDLGDGQGLAAARTLIAGADVALFDHAPGRLEALGLDAETLTAAHPGLVHAWMPPYGTTGEWSDLAPHHLLLAGLTGVAFRQGAWSDQPVHLTLPIAWYAQAVLGAGAIGAALFERTRSGRGQGLVVTGLHGAAEAAPPSKVFVEPPLPRPVPPGGNPRYRLYQCADGEWFFLGTLFNNFYRKAFEVLGLEDAFDALEADMLAARDLLEGMFLTRTRDEWLEALRANDVPCGPIGRREAWFASEVVRDAGLRLELAHPTLGVVATPAPSVKFATTPASVRGLAKSIAAPPAWSPRAAPESGAPDPGAPDPGAPDPGAPDPGAPDSGAPDSGAPDSGAPDSGGPLAGVKVLNLGTVIAGAYAGTILTQLGADVAKIEPREGDPFRSDGSQFMAYNRGNRALGLDLKTPSARALFLDLVRQADVVIDNYRLGVRGRLGIDYAALKAANPRIISCSINAYGESGPRAALPGFDPLLQAEGGMMAGQGGAGDPVLYTIAVNDIATAATVAGAVIAALNARERTGEGQEVLTSLMAQSLLFQSGEVTTYDGRPPNVDGDVDCIGVSALHRFYACADGWIGLVAETGAEARALGEVVGLDLDDGALTEPRDGALADGIATALAARPRGEALTALRAAGVAAAPAIRGAEALEDAFLAQNGFVEAWTHPRLGPVVSTRAFSAFSRTPTGFSRPTPDLGEHSAEILGGYGVPADRIAELVAQGAVF
ncbi:CoA transferase [Phenylobacterium sp.]|uniref:CaiB/BaiF CoA transferase family protein n=1 Tax=Phenylobacterium sp. TaxID=1871053 RepID=UPI00301DA659